MNKRAAVCLCLGIALAGWSQAAAGQDKPAAPSEEPHYQGKSLTYWTKALKAKELTTRFSAVSVLAQEIGPEGTAAIGPLLEGLRDPSLQIVEPLLAVCLLRIGPA